MIKSDFHTHTTYCDGENSIKEMIDYAVSNGMESIGFSGHSHTPFDESYCMSNADTEKYIKEVSVMKRKYSDIEIYLGIERDRFSDIINIERFDYVIGSVHYVIKDGVYLPVDESRDVFTDNINKYYEGDIFAFCEDYYKLLSSFSEVDNIEIIGHFDLVTKFNEGGCLFDIKNRIYESAVNNALYKLAAADKILEINTGAVSRGYRNMPYPDSDILVKWRKLGGRIIFSGDAHSCKGLCYRFDEAEKLAVKCGFDKYVIFKNGKLTEISF